MYEKPNTDVVVITPYHSAIEHQGNHYKLPDDVPDDERVRVERYDNTLSRPAARMKHEGPVEIFKEEFRYISSLRAKETIMV